MGIYDRDYYRKDGPSFLDSIIPDGRVCRWLIGLNIVLFLLQVIFTPVQVAGQAAVAGRGFVTEWLILDTSAVAHGEVWRLLTYAFLHEPGDITHILFNMLFLWWFGTDVEMIYGSREFLGFYLVSAFLGGVAYQAWAMAKGDVGACLGASGAVTAVLVLCACHFPHRTILVMFLVPVPIWLFAVFNVLQDTYRLATDSRDLVASAVHLAGAAFGFVYYKQHWRVLSWLPSFKLRTRYRNRSNLRLYQPAEDKEPVPVAAAPSSREMDEHLEAKLDAVLEKVSRHGKDSLTEGEHKILMRASEIYKRKRT
jgi:membrane associated rhomboid family serine protease